MIGTEQVAGCTSEDAMKINGAGLMTGTGTGMMTAEEAQAGTGTGTEIETGIEAETETGSVSMNDRTGRRTESHPWTRCRPRLLGVSALD